MNSNGEMRGEVYANANKNLVLAKKTDETHRF